MNPLESLRPALGMARLAVTRPREVVDRYDGWREYNRSTKFRANQAAGPTRSQRDAVGAVHELLGVEGCRTCAEEILSVGRAVAELLPDGHSHDGGGSLTSALWTLIRHSRPKHVIETGVARGVSSAFILSALQRNDHGHLWSIDLPPLSRPKEMTGSAVPESVRDRWTYLHGSSRRVLPALVDELGSVDLFLHDGMHTESTMAFEFNIVWTYLTKGGTLVADDADFNSAFPKFTRRIGREPLLLGDEDKGNTIGIIHI